MSEEKFQEFLQRELRDYNRPPDNVPADAMWDEIAKARASRRVVAAAPARRSMRVYAPWIGMAATLLIGVGIGRFMMNDAATPSQIATTQDSLPAASPVTPTTVVTDTAAPAPSLIEVPTQRLASHSGTPATPRALPAATRAEPTTSVTLASRTHLQRAEALVTVVAATPADAVMDSLTGKWAREMLTNTRLLLDSPAGDDPLRRRLLEDLETVLVQLVQRSGASAADREILDRTLERTQLLTRLRTGAAGI
jgi:hypothetical protein